MKPGRLIAFVGPSGVGKDSVMEAIAEAAPKFQLVRRDITRPADLGGENFNPISEDDFALSTQAGQYCLHWQAHGLSYGIPRDVLRRATGGVDQLVNLSRTVLKDAAAVFPAFLIINLTAKAETLADRVRGRGREDPADIARRLSRKTKELPTDLHVHTVSNDGPLFDTVRQVLRLIQPVRA